MSRIVFHRTLVFAATAWMVVASMVQVVADPIIDNSAEIPPDTAQQTSELDTAQSLFKLRDFEGAMKHLKKAVQENRELPPAAVLMAELYAQANMQAEMQAALEQAIVDAPSDPQAYLLLAQVALNERRLDEAERLCRKAESLLPGLDHHLKRKASLRLSLGNILATLAEIRQDWAGAEKQLGELLKLEPKNGTIVQRLAYSRFRQKNVDGALQTLRDGVKKGAFSIAPEMVLAQFFQNAGDADSARKWVDAALDASPKDINLRLAACQWALGMGQLDEAQKHAIAAIRIDPKSLDAKLSRGVIAMFQKDFETAEACFQTLFERVPGDFVASNNLALAMIEQDTDAKNRRALELAEANMKQFPKLASAASTCGWVFYKLGRFEEADKALQTAASLGPLSADTAYYKARVAEAQGRKAEARQLLEVSLKAPGLFLYRQEAEDLLRKMKQ